MVPLAVFIDIKGYLLQEDVSNSFDFPLPEDLRVAADDSCGSSVRFRVVGIGPSVSNSKSLQFPGDDVPKGSCPFQTDFVGHSVTVEPWQQF